MIAQNKAEFEIGAGSRTVTMPGSRALGKTIALLDDGGMPFDFMTYCECPMGHKGKGGHATSVARVVHEVAPGAKVICLPYTYLSYTEKEKSIKWLLENPPDIINCSFSGGSFDGYIEQLEQLNIPIVCSAGNDGKTDKVNYPARLPFTVAVGSLEEWRDMPANDSNGGPDLDCLGYTNIEIPLPEGTMNFNGTSAAAPFVSGMLALLGKMTGTEAKSIIKNNCIDYYEQGHDWRSGYGLFVLPKLEEPEMRDINLLHPDLQPKARKLIELAKAKGIKIIISQTWRTKAEQDELYAQGRTKQGQIVTNVKYPNSLHCWGVAFDVAVIINGKASWIAAHFNIVGPIGESLGLDWGGRWKSPDKPHFQMPGHAVSELIRKYGTPEGFKKSWVEPAKGVANVAGFEGPAKVVYKSKELSAGILEGKTFVELRALAEFLGLKVAWDNATKTVTLS